MRHKSGERRAESREQRADTRFGRDCAQDGQVRRFPPVRTTCQSIGYERSRVQRQRKHANARFCKSGHVAGTPEVIHPKLVVFISEPISFFSSGRLRALRTTKILVPSGNDLRPDGHIGTPKKRPNVATQLAQLRRKKLPGVFRALPTKDFFRHSPAIQATAVDAPVPPQYSAAPLCDRKSKSRIENNKRGQAWLFGEAWELWWCC